MEKFPRCNLKMESDNFLDEYKIRQHEKMLESHARQTIHASDYLSNTIKFTFLLNGMGAAAILSARDKEVIYCLRDVLPCLALGALFALFSFFANYHRRRLGIRDTSKILFAKQYEYETFLEEAKENQRKRNIPPKFRENIKKWKGIRTLIGYWSQHPVPYLTTAQLFFSIGIIFAALGMHSLQNPTKVHPRSPSDDAGGIQRNGVPPLPPAGSCPHRMPPKKPPSLDGGCLS